MRNLKKIAEVVVVIINQIVAYVDISICGEGNNKKSIYYSSCCWD